MQRSLKEVFLFNKKVPTKQVKLKCLSDVEHANVKLTEEEQGLKNLFFHLNHDLTCLNDHFYQRWEVLQPFSENKTQKHTKKRSALLLKLTKVHLSQG